MAVTESGGLVRSAVRPHPRMTMGSRPAQARGDFVPRSRDSWHRHSPYAGSRRCARTPRRSSRNFGVPTSGRDLIRDCTEAIFPTGKTHTGTSDSRRVSIIVPVPSWLVWNYRKRSPVCSANSRICAWRALRKPLPGRAGRRFVGRLFAPDLVEGKRLAHAVRRVGTPGSLAYRVR